MQFGLERADPVPISRTGFNINAELPYGLKCRHIESALNDWIEFLAFINSQLLVKKMPRLETFLMPANFSSLVSEFINVRLPIYCATIVRNRYHNGHPDLLPKGKFPNDAVQHSQIGIEVKSSRYRKRWQGHNPERVWLLVFVFEANSANDEAQAMKSGRWPLVKPFHFLEVLGAQVEKDDWQYSGRSAGSRRTITASIKPSGYHKMSANWIYRDCD